MEDLEANKFGKYECPCCGYYTLEESRRNTFDICPVCYWEDDGIQYQDPGYTGGANKMSLNQARINFTKYGAKSIDAIPFVRAPDFSERL